ncbi:MAG: diguanylate cyclase [Lachnospiraceae bacterium]|nr:diguanylate cyclase [Lachnospiraceae bacterium]
MKTMKKIWYASCFDRFFLGILIGIELLMSFTSLGYIHIPPISITIAYIPILAAGCLYGPAQSVIVGFVFGIASMYKASAYYVLPADAVFSPFLSGSPMGSFLLSVCTRMLFGFLIGAAFLLARKGKHYRLWMGVISAIAPKLHSLIVYSAMGILFPELGYFYSSALHWDWGDAVFAMVCVGAVELLWAFYQSKTIRNIKQCIDQSVNNPYSARKMNLFFVVFECFLLCMAVFATVYFSQRESYMLGQHGVAVSDVISFDLLHLQIQFLIAFLALNLISVIMLMAIYKYMSYKEYRGEMDGLTGVMGRRMFLYYCEKAQETKGMDAGKTGWFLFVDVDYFKEINDTFGHMVGDKVLREIAVNLQTILEEDGKVGRIGGDEFAVIIEDGMPQEELEQRLEQFLKIISGILPDKKVSCSIGAYQFAYPRNVKLILSETDEMLYKAKEKGRACFVMKACDDMP